MIDGQYRYGQRIQFMEDGLQAPPTASAGVTVTELGDFIQNTVVTDPQSLGTFNAATAGLIVVAGGIGDRDGSDNITSVSIGGSAGTLLITAGDVENRAFIAYREVIAGNHEVVVDFDATTANHSPANAVTVFLVTGYSSATPHDTDITAHSGGVATRNVTLDLSAGGAAFYGFCKQNNTVIGWSAATETAEASGGSGRAAAAAYKLTPSTVAGNVETISWTTNANNAAVGASWV